VAACVCLALGAAAARQERALAFTHVAVVDVAAGTVRHDQTVIVERRRIATVGASAGARVPRGARVVDATGRYMIPGLWDMHVHLGKMGSATLPVFLANGVTSVRDMGGGLRDVRAWRDSIAAGAIAGPRIRLPGPIVESARWREAVIALFREAGDEGGARGIEERIGVRTPEDARRAIDSIAALGGEFVKVRTQPDARTYLALLHAARARGLRVVGHASTHVPLADASDSGMLSIEHGFHGVVDGRGGMELDRMPPADRRALFERFARNRTAVTPTLVAQHGYRLTPDDVVQRVIDDSLGRVEPRRRYVSRALAARWLGQIALKRHEGPFDWTANYASRLRDLREMDAAGVPILAGTDAGVPLVFAGFGLHDELELLVRDGGLTAAEALRAATLTPAATMGTADSLGAIAPGMLADLLLLDGDPLRDIRRTRDVWAVVANGRLHVRSELDALLAGARRAIASKDAGGSR
jgi:imidazolonepropionase-like amidohydrolase